MEKMDFKSDLPESTLPYRLNRRPKVSRTLQGVLLLISAIVLSTFLPGISVTTWNSEPSLEQVASPAIALADPASQWKDDVWPIRQQTPWDISTDYPFPRLLEYDVTEGTWLRLDVHPKTGEIVFDMLGDLYCLPADAYSDAQLASGDLSKAHPILLGIPHDSDPHFSPEGDRIVFRSDAELGVENIWVTEWKGCETMNVRSHRASSELHQALAVKDLEEELLASGVKETTERKQRRLIREGRLGGALTIAPNCLPCTDFI